MKFGTHDPLDVHSQYESVLPIENLVWQTF